MSHEEINQKLKNFLNEHDPFTEECHVVYLLVEIRKMLDQENNNKYPILRFYCNWSVHTSKRPTKEMEPIMNKIYKDIVEPTNNLVRKKIPIVGFMYMEDLKLEMKKFLHSHQLPEFLTKKTNWLEFVKLFVRILADQPIKNPCADIKEFAFLPAARGCVRGRIDFNSNIEGRSYYEFGNGY